MSEQDTYGAHLGITPERKERAKAALRAYDLKHSTGSEQERYASHFTWERPDKTVDTIWSSPGAAVGSSEHEAINPRFPIPRHAPDTSAVGILRSNLLPSLGLQSGLSILAYGASRATNRVDGKDLLWPCGQVIQAWSSAIGKQVACDNNLNFSRAVGELSYAHKLILSGVTLWGGRLFYRALSRSISRGHDEPRYELAKSEPDFWQKSLFTIFLPEAVFQTLISLPFTLPFKDAQRNLTPYATPALSEIATGLGVFCFSAGFALEVLADVQLAEHAERSKDLDKSGVWSIVRHPKYVFPA